MKETLELRVNYDYAHLLFKDDEGKTIGTSVRVIEISKEDPRYSKIPIISKQVKEKYGTGFFFSWRIKRKYSLQELETAKLLHIKINAIFEPAGGWLLVLLQVLIQVPKRLQDKRQDFLMQNILKKFYNKCPMQKI